MFKNVSLFFNKCLISLAFTCLSQVKVLVFLLYGFEFKIQTQATILSNNMN